MSTSSLICRQMNKEERELQKALKEAEAVHSKAERERLVRHRPSGPNALPRTSYQVLRPPVHLSHGP